MIELFLGLAIVTIGYNIFRTRKIQKEIRELKSINDSLTEAIFLPSQTLNVKYKDHNWIFISTEPIYSHWFSMDAVLITTRRCKKCGLMHRFISAGIQFAKDKDFLDLEGFYLHGKKIPDHGCLNEK